MKKVIISIVEDSPFMLEAYENFFRSLSLEEMDVDIEVNQTSIEDLLSGSKRDEVTSKILFVNLRKPSLDESFLKYGTNIYAQIRKLNKSLKIIAVTNKSTNLRLYSEIRSIEPDIFIIMDILD